MAPRPTSDELWGHHLMPTTLDVDILTPNGLLVSLSCNREATLGKIKSDLLMEVKKNVLFRLLSDFSCYIFVSITQDAKLEEFYDETRRLCDLRLFQPLLKLVEPVGNKEEKILNSEISMAIGTAVSELESSKDPEIIEFRRNILNLCKSTVEERESLPDHAKALYFYPPEIDKTFYYKKTLCSKNNEPISPNSSAKDGVAIGDIKLKIWTPSAEKGKTIEVPRIIEPSVLISRVLNDDMIHDEKNVYVDLDKLNIKPEDYVMKVCGFEEYLLGDHHLYNYKYIRLCISQRKCPELVMVSKEMLYNSIPSAKFLTPSFLRRSPAVLTPEQEVQAIQESVDNQKLMFLWGVSHEAMFKIKIKSASYVNVGEVDKIYVKVGLFFGPEPLCNSRDTMEIPPNNPKWEESLEFGIHVSDIPRNARLCLSICSVSYRKKRREDVPLAWANMPLFDFKNRLKTDRMNYNLWPMPKGHNDLLNPLGMIGSNFYKDSPSLDIEFDRYSNPVIFPLDSQIEEYAQIVKEMEATMKSPEYQSSDYKGARSKSRLLGTPIKDNDMEKFYEVIKGDPLSEMSEQEKDLVWRLRDLALKVPDSLPKLLDSVKWNSKEEVSQLYALLKHWSPVEDQTALELLDCKYADLVVRNYAVKWLDDSLCDELLSQYLLQLVQMVKHEHYLDNQLSKFLLQRALKNRNVGHYFFWFLKAEIHNPMCAQRCVLLLEAYCRGIGNDMLKSTIRQVIALEKLTKLTESLKERKEDIKEKLRFLSNQVEQTDYLEALQNLVNPLNYCLTLGSLIVSECRIMDSAKRPLWLVWSNPDSTGKNFFKSSAIIFKNGDDLRQDMLTLQVIRIMDLIWRCEGYDFKMIPYTCLATGKHVGMIEVVKRAKTVMNIQRCSGTLAAYQFDSTYLHKWIIERNKENYQLAVENFTKSCAGYCVATFILGIGDRNPANIMINEDGQIFHIDFGHFLGHFKKKFGINRERVPFVLTDDFLYVIGKGVEHPHKSKEFEEFKQLCFEAYLSLRRHSKLLITLFTMMLSTGIPELQSMDDIGYLRKTLQVDETEPDALDYFRRQLNDAYGGALSTKFDWFCHSLKHR